MTDEERKVASMLAREVQCHQPRSKNCRICQLLDKWDDLHPSLGTIAPPSSWHTPQAS